MSELAAAEHRALRELYATTRRLHDHWTSLAGALGEPDAGPLLAGARDARDLLRDLRSHTAVHGLYGGTAAQGAGRTLSALHSAGDHTLERNQALRLAVLDATHVVLLLGYLERLARVRGDAELAGFHARWGERFGATERTARAAAVEVGDAPGAAIAPAHAGAAGRAGHALAVGIGTLGEWVDRRLARSG